MTDSADTRKVVLISGGSDGLGREIARLLATDHRVVLLARDADRVRAAATELACEWRACDVGDAVAVDAVVASVLAAHGRIDCLVNSAGLWIEGPLTANSPEDIARVMDANATGTILLSRACAEAMKAARSGLIINIISQAGIYAKAERSVYHASKWAVTGFTKALQSELAPDGIRVTGIYPGKMDTEMFAKRGISKGMKDALDPREAARLVRFVVDAPEDVCFPELGIKHINN